MPDQTHKWEFLQQPEKMGMATDMFEKTLSQSDFRDEAILVREALQNCKDARPADSTLPAQATIRKRKLTGPAVKHIAEVLKIGDCKDRADHLNNKERRKQFTQLLNGKVPLSVLEISDENTIGLGGEWNGHTEDDHFSRLVINLGASLKSEGGGSFGFGKTVFAQQSRLNLVVYYSVFEPTDRSEKAHARLMAVWLMKPHSYNNLPQTGFGFFGQPNPKNKQTVQPFVDKDAHTLAEALGMPKRTIDQKGTTVMIIDCDPSMPEIAESAERYWWPSIHDDDLSIRVFDDTEQIPVKPAKNPCVNPFLSAYKDLQTDRPSGRSEKKYASGTRGKEFRKIGDKKLGWLAMRMLSELEVKLWKDHELKRLEETTQLGGIARMRPGSGMVVSYETDNLSNNKPCIVLFQGAESIEQYLRISEPPTHDRWNSGEARLNDEKHFKPDEFEYGLGKKIVSAVNKRIKDTVRDILDDQSDPAPPPEYKLKSLETLLAKLMNAGSQEQAVPSGPPRPFSISIKSNRIDIGGSLYDEADIKIKLNDDYPKDTLDIVLEVTRVLLGIGTSERTIDKLSCTVEELESGKTVEGELVVLPLRLVKGVSMKLNARGTTWDKFKTRYRANVRRPK